MTTPHNFFLLSLTAFELVTRVASLTHTNTQQHVRRPEVRGRRQGAQRVPRREQLHRGVSTGRG